MDDLITRLVERDGAQDWPPPGNPAVVRRLATRRTRVRRIIIASSAVVLLVGAGVATTLALGSGPDGSARVEPAKHSPATSAETSATPLDGPTDISGVQVTLPQGWTTGYVLVNELGTQTCVGPAPMHDSDCPMHVFVDRDASATDQPQLLSTMECHPNGPSTVTPTPLDWDGPAAVVWAMTCDSGMGPTSDQYSLKHNTFSVAAGEPPQNDVVRSNFESAVFPPGWPH